MAKQDKKTKNKRRWTFSLSDTQRWVIGIVVLFVGLYVAYSTIAYMFTWKANQVYVQYGDFLPSDTKVAGGSLSAWLGYLLVGKCFGVFGVVASVAVVLAALRLMRRLPTRLERVGRVSLLVMILGSITVGAIAGFNGTFGSGLGGELGTFSAEWLIELLGPGIILLLLCGWILLAVYISSKTIDKLDNWGREVVHTGRNVTNMLISRRKDEDEVIEEDGSDDDLYDDDDDVEEDDPEAFVEVSDEDFTKDESYSEELTDFEVTIPTEEQIETSDEEANTDEEGDFEINQMEEEPSVDATILGAGGVVDGEVVEKSAYEDPEAEDFDDMELYDPLKELSSYRKPAIEGVLMEYDSEVQVTAAELKENKEQIVQTLLNFGIKIDKIKATIGPTITLYEIVPAAGIKIARIKGLEQDIALSLKALGIRMIAPMPGKGTIGIEVPNKERQMVSMCSVVKSVKFQESTAELPIALGKNIQNETVVVDLAKLPHLLVAGATGQGKSVGLNVIISSLLYKKHPAELKFVMVDPKKVELSMYAKLEKHFLAKMESEDEAIMTDTQKVIYTLNSLITEMEARYELLRTAQVKKITEYNKKFTERRLNPRKGHRYMPYIVLVIDEFCDMIMTAGKEVEQPITRLAQLARAVGIHMIIATQRPDVKVITGLIKANFPARIAFKVTSIVDSRTILDQTGANQLIGMGDMLVSINSELSRVQCAFIDTPEIESIVNSIHAQAGYSSAYPLPDYVPDGSGDVGGANENIVLDSMFAEVARFVVSNGQGSTSAIQRRFSLGYNRAGRIMDQLEYKGIVGPAMGSKPREVYITDMMSLERILDNI